MKEYKKLYVMILQYNCKDVITSSGGDGTDDWTISPNWR